MTTNTTDLAAALNECMPLTHGLSTYERAEVKDAIRLKIEGRELWWNKSDAEIIGILWAECVRRGWHVIAACLTAATIRFAEGTH